MSDYNDRHLLEFVNTWPEFADAFLHLSAVVFGSEELSFQLRFEVFTVSSLSAGCRHCQAHGAYALHLGGSDTERIQALWEFETSELFDEAERTALRFAAAAGSVPNAVTAEHHAALREHFTDRQITELVCVISVAGFLNRYNDTLATVTDQDSVDWAATNLGTLGWEVGKHAGASEEQQPLHPLKLGMGG
ncbi:MAG: carboxymuconolactone decarboxylase family protein [Actinomycetota bacterium]